GTVRTREIQTLELVGGTIGRQRAEGRNALVRDTTYVVAATVECDERARVGFIANAAAIQRQSGIRLLNRVLDLDAEVIDRELKSPVRGGQHEAERGRIRTLRLDVCVAFEVPVARIHLESACWPAIAEQPAGADDLPVVQLAEVAGARIA